MANWGSRRLMFRFPAGLLNLEAIKAYCVQDCIALKTSEHFDVLDMDLSEEEGGDWIEAEGSLSGLIALRKSIVEADYRCLYLAWLKCVDITGGKPRYGRKQQAPLLQPPAVPAGLRQLTSALARFVDAFDIPASLVEAAAENSPELAAPADLDFRPLVAQLSREACDGFLCRIAQGDAIAPLELKKQLLGLLPQPAAISGPSLSIEALLARAEAIETARRRRRELEARRKHEAEMIALADREAETWAQATSLVDLRKSTSYEEAIRLLNSLAKLAEFRGAQTDYRRRLSDLCERYGRLTGFLRRVEQAKLLDEKTQ